jgi:hypothetical protein
MEIKQHAHVIITMAPTPSWECYDIETCEMWERIKGLCIVANFLVEVFVYEKIFQNKLNAKRCEIKVLYETLCIWLKNCSKILYTLVNGLQLFKKQ